MKKGIVALSMLVFLATAAGALRAGGFYLEARGAYFQPTDGAFKDIYGSGTTFGGEVGFGLRGNLSLWLSGDFFTKTGKLTFTGEETKIQITPACAGVQFRFSASRLSPYVGAGVGYFQFKETNPIGEVKEGNLGFVGKAGLSFDLGTAFFLDLQAKYSYCKVKPQEVEADLGGFQAGLGLGFRF